MKLHRWRDIKRERFTDEQIRDLDASGAGEAPRGCLFEAQARPQGKEADESLMAQGAPAHTVRSRA